jgi:hypothetical protein
MKNLENILKILEANAEDFDIEIFIEEFMSIPFQIKKIDKNLNKLNVNNQKRYYKVLKTLKTKAYEATPQNQHEKDVLKQILSAIDDEFNKQVA